MSSLLSDHKLVGVSKKRLVNPKRILDLCSGEGFIARGLGKLYPDCEIVRSDIHPYKGVIQSDLFENIDGKFDAIVCNPPYIPSHLCLCTFDPIIAYDGGKDGMDIIRRVDAEADDYLKEDGLLFLEIHPTHADKLKGFEIQKDDSNEYRYAIRRKR